MDTEEHSKPVIKDDSVEDQLYLSNYTCNWSDRTDSEMKSEDHIFQLKNINLHVGQVSETNQTAIYLYASALFIISSALLVWEHTLKTP